MQYKDILRRRWKLCIEYEDLRKQSSQAVIIPREYCRPTWEKLCLQGKDIVKSLSRVQLFVTPWTVAYEAPRSMGFSRQEYWSVLPFPSPGDHPNPGNEPGSPALQADSLLSEPSGSKMGWRALQQKSRMDLIPSESACISICALSLESLLLGLTDSSSLVQLSSLIYLISRGCL